MIGVFTDDVSKAFYDSTEAADKLIKAQQTLIDLYNELEDIPKKMERQREIISQYEQEYKVKDKIYHELLEQRKANNKL